MAYDVLIVDMAHHGEDYVVRGFPTRELRVEYARRRVRATVEELRAPGITPEKLKAQWFVFGEDAMVLGADPSYSGSDQLDYFIAQPATPEEIDWQAIRKIAPPPDR